MTCIWKYGGGGRQSVRSIREFFLTLTFNLHIVLPIDSRRTKWLEQSAHRSGYLPPRLCENQILPSFIVPLMFNPYVLIAQP